jgi:protein-L-isoaspartate O-methyltransferase
MTEEELERKIEALGPWVYGFRYRGKVWGTTSRYAAQKPIEPVIGNRIKSFFELFPDARRVLELGGMEGIDTFQLASREGVEVVSVEGRLENVRKAEFLNGLYGFGNIRFVHADLESYDPRPLGDFDAVMCSGILYHLEKPWTLIQRLSQVTGRIFIWTHYWASAEGTEVVDGYRVKHVDENYPESLLNGLSEHSRWFTLDSLTQALRDSGFVNINVLRQKPSLPGEESHKHVCDVTMAVSK